MAVHVWPQLQNSTDVKSFLGLCGFYQRFVADYATVATPLTNLMGKKAVWKWGEEEERAFQALKVRLLQYPVLTVPNFKLPMILHTDASDVGVWATLSQKDEGGAKIGGLSKSEVVISGEELPGEREGDVSAGGYVRRVETFFVRCDSFGVHRQLGLEPPAEEPEAIAEASEVVGEVTAVRP